MKKKKFIKLAAGVFCITFLSLGSVSAKGEELLTDSNAVQEDNKEPLNLRKEEETDLFNSGITEEPAKKIENASTSGAAEKPAEKIEDTFTSKATEEPAGKIEDAFTSGSTEEPGEKDEDGEKEEDAVRIIQDGIIYQEEESYNRYFHVVGYTEEAKGKTEAGNTPHRQSCGRWSMRTFPASCPPSSVSGNKNLRADAHRAE